MTEHSKKISTKDQKLMTEFRTSFQKLFPNQWIGIREEIIIITSSEEHMNEVLESRKLDQNTALIEQLTDTPEPQSPRQSR